MMRRSMRVMMCVAAVVVAGAARCPVKKKPVVAKPAVNKASAIPDSADQVLFGVRYVLTYLGVSQGVMLADTAFTYDDGSRLELRRVNVTFYTKLGTKDGVMTSRTGQYNSRLSRLEASGDVVVSRDDGSRLTSPVLVYDQQRDQIYTDTTFVLVRPGEQQLAGKGFESDPRLTRFKCLKECKGGAPVSIPRK